MDKPTDKISAVRFLVELEKKGIPIVCSEGSQWRMLPYADFIKLAQKLWEKHKAALSDI